MRPFRFRFDKVLHVRETREKSSRSRFAVALRTWRAEEKALERARREHQEALDALASARATGDVSQALLLEPGLRVTARRLTSQTERTREAAREASRRREDLMAAARDRRVVEKLRERRRWLHLYRENWEEQKRVDEVALQFNGRSRNPTERR
ncbi:MAG: flagellar export protein FliJ [Bacillota bacterium]|nr:flagellar export protein FliJ [Bacillota bacterium]MDI7248799.1 flagellar export protein FliJ [Bacillota bacterium]